jgi:hypothetical protein
MKTLAGPEGRVALYALASVTGEVVLAFEVSREEAQAVAQAGAARAGQPKPPPVVLMKDAAAFADATERLKWKTAPTQILVDASRIGPELAARIAEGLSCVAPVVVAVAAASAVEAAVTEAGRTSR